LSLPGKLPDSDCRVGRSPPVVLSDRLALGRVGGLLGNELFQLSGWTAQIMPLVREANEIPGSQTGSRRRQTPGDAGRRAQTISTACWHFRRRQAMSGDGNIASTSEGSLVRTQLCPLGGLHVLAGSMFGFGLPPQLPRPGPGQTCPAFPRKRPAQLRTGLRCVGRPRFTCGQDRNMAAFAQVEGFMPGAALSGQQRRCPGKR